MNDIERNDELYHYGVLGMKWGVRRGRVAEAYAKATAKRDKLNATAENLRVRAQKAKIKANSGVSAKYKKLQEKADKAQNKADKKKYGLFSNPNKAAELQSKADKAQFKANKYKYRAEKRENKAGIAEAKYLRAQRKAEKWVKAMDKVFIKADNDYANKLDRQLFTEQTKKKNVSAVYKSIDWDKAASNGKYATKKNAQIIKVLNSNIKDLKTPTGKSMEYVEGRSGAIGDFNLRVKR